ncbi:MAG: hypothetical protein HOE90_05700 [Bacteriovoracaceae bacterium]|jgi:hypothetical protein|nr:hypothetical protein [Bacteriovoracaceae bacterium]
MAVDEKEIKGCPKLLSEGWKKRHLVDPDRAAESIELYESMGLEAIAKKLDPKDLGDSCEGCKSALCTNYLMVYTKVKK